ncbi:DNA mismatch repair endonuclease MutL, partial [Enhygromyxa salina]|uniref:DNA mismatch repair endonuclease MutL n=1 Tax=Enhygromyxa salina TaxID=215803 RepID=UPI000D08C4EB
MSGRLSSSADDSRIAVLPASLADQIAAGEVVERPGSIVKELIENAIDAGASRVEVELEAGGSERIRVIDDGHGIHREDLILSVTRHATSKLRAPEDLVEIHTLGFRGEALASIAAVARVEIRSRLAALAVGHRLRSSPGEEPTIEPIGMPFGTQIEVAHLFASVPARRKFLRSEATEVGHCVDAVTRAALVHPAVHFRVRHGGRELLELTPADQTSRVIAVLQRRGGGGPFHRFAGERRGVHVEGWFGPPSAATRQRGASFVVVRRRVVRERTLVGVLKQAYGDALPRGTHPAACLFVEPPRGTVDVNVHPQKSEVRFSDAQAVYAVVRELVGEHLADAPWRRPDASDPGDPRDPGDPGDPRDDGEDHDWASSGRAGARAALAGWSRREGLGDGLAAHDRGEHGGARAGGRSGSGPGSGSGSGYRLGTRAAGADYRADKVDFRGEVERLRSSLAEVHRETDRAWSGRPSSAGPSLPFDHEPDTPAPDPVAAEPRGDGRGR